MQIEITKKEHKGIKHISRTMSAVYFVVFKGEQKCKIGCTDDTFEKRAQSFPLQTVRHEVLLEIPTSAMPQFAWNVETHLLAHLRTKGNWINETGANTWEYFYNPHETYEHAVSFLPVAIEMASLQERFKRIQKNWGSDRQSVSIRLNSKK